MKIDSGIIRSLTRKDFRVLTAVEMGMKNHEYVPTPLIASIAGVKRSGTAESLGNLHKFKLLQHESRKYDGYRLNSGGYDILAIKAFVNKLLIQYIDKQIGVGKEADVYLVYDDEGIPLALKLHKLGRTSFRSVRSKREYHGRRSASWLYLSRLAAHREFQYIKQLYDLGFPVPKPYEVNRNCILMSFVEGVLLNNIAAMSNPRRLYIHLMDTLDELLSCGLVHGDFNEFNLIIDDEEQFILIDMPQMIQASHPDAELYFNRDVESIRRYFDKKFGFRSSYRPSFSLYKGDQGASSESGSSSNENERREGNESEDDRNGNDSASLSDDSEEGSDKESDTETDDEELLEMTLPKLQDRDLYVDDISEDEEEENRNDIPRYPFATLREERKMEEEARKEAMRLQKEHREMQRRENIEGYADGEDDGEDGVIVSEVVKRELAKEKRRRTTRHLKGKGKGRDRKKGKGNIKNKNPDFV